MLQPKKFAPSRLKSDQKAVFDERLGHRQHVLVDQGRQKFETIETFH